MRRDAGTSVKIQIGCDESGTGALAGPFTVCAYACQEKLLGELYAIGANDSKAMSDKARRAVATGLVALKGAWANIQIVSAARSMPQREAWREAIAKAVSAVIVEAGKEEFELLIDGKEDTVLTGYFSRVWGLKAKWCIGGDRMYASIGAASILAKTERNDHMLDIAKLYPLYGFEKHMGYGADAHFEAIAVHGITPEHRRVKPLAHYFGEVHAETEDVAGDDLP